METTPPSASFFAQVSQDLMQIGEETPTLQSVVERAVEVVPACDWASVTLRRRRNRTETVAASSDIARQADQLQYDLAEGPCLEAAVTARRASPTASRPPRSGRGGAPGSRRPVCTPPRHRPLDHDEVLGALNLYAAQPDAFTRDDLDVAEVYATHATNALTAARMSSGLRTALHTRHMIGSPRAS